MNLFNLQGRLWSTETVTLVAFEHCFSMARLWTLEDTLKKGSTVTLFVKFHFRVSVCHVDFVLTSLHLTICSFQVLVQVVLASVRVILVSTTERATKNTTVTAATVGGRLSKVLFVLMVSLAVYIMILVIEIYT